MLQKEIRAQISRATTTAAHALMADHNSLVDLVSNIERECSVALDILNELLMYEKIEGGLMALETVEVSIATFLHEAIQPFTVQVK